MSYPPPMQPGQSRRSQPPTVPPPQGTSSYPPLPTQPDNSTSSSSYHTPVPPAQRTMPNSPSMSPAQGLLTFSLPTLPTPFATPSDGSKEKIMQENMAQLQREGEKNDTMEWPSQEAWDRNCKRLERELDERDREEEEQEKKKQQKAVEPRKRKMQEEEQSKEEQKDVKPWKRAYRKKKMREEELGKEEQRDVKRREKRASMTKEEIMKRKEQQRERKETEAQAKLRPMNLVQIERDQAENDGRKGEEGREIEESEVPASSSGERLTLTSLDQPAAANPVFGYVFGTPDGLTPIEEPPLRNTPESSSGDRYGSATTYGQRVHRSFEVMAAEQSASTQSESPDQQEPYGSSFNGYSL